MAEEQAAGGEVVEQAPVGMDMEAALADIAGSLALPQEEGEAVEGQEAAPGNEVGEENALKSEVVDTEKAEPEKVEPNSNDIAPDTWRKEAKEAWATVPPVVKEELRKREADISSYVERVKQPVAVGEKLTGIMQPYLPMFEKMGVDPWHNIGAMLQVQERMAFGSPEQKLAMFQELANQAGIKFEGGQLSAQPNAQDQYVRQLEQRLSKLEGGVNQVTSTVQEARQKELMDNVTTFANDKAHPHFFAVTDRITHLITTGAAKTLQEAYDLAILADPVIRQQVVEGEAKQLAEARTKADRERTVKARKSGVAVVRSTHGGKAVQPSGSIDDTLVETLAEIRAR